MNDDESTETSESESSHEDKENDFMLMAVEDLEMSCTEMNDEDAIVDMEGELMSALEEIDRLRIKKRKQKQLLIQYETNGKDISLIKLELEEAKKIEETLKQQLAESNTRCEHLEKEVVIVKKDLEKFQALYHQNISSIKASEELNNILNRQRSPQIKFGLGYGQGASSSDSESKESSNLINFQNSKQAEIPRIINVEACKDNNENRSKSDKKQENTDLNSKSVQSRVHEKEPYNRIKYADQNYNYEHHNSIHYFSRNPPRVRYVNFFNGYCFCCSNFGHRAANCFYNFRNIQRRMSNNKHMTHQSVYNHMGRVS